MFLCAKTADPMIICFCITDHTFGVSFSTKTTKIQKGAQALGGLEKPPARQVVQREASPCDFSLVRDFGGRI